MLVLEPLWRGYRAGQDQPQLLTSLGLPGSRYKVICNLLLLMLGLEALRRGYAANQGWLLLVLGLGPFGRHHNVS